jgi:hypothetical protein
MDIDTFKKAVDISVREDGLVIIGGGEPTVHPKFYEFMEYALGFNVDITTNGKIKDRALYLLDLAKNRKINLTLSLDKFHDPINCDVQKLYEEYAIKGLVGINVVKKPEFIGRALYNCTNSRIRRRIRRSVIKPTCCGIPCVQPNGNIYRCICKNSKIIGTVNSWRQQLFASDIYKLKNWSCCNHITIVR